VTINSLEKGKVIERSLKCINDLWSIVCYPYPKMFSKDKKDQKRGFTYDGNVVSFASLDEETRKQMKEIMMAVLDKRRKELNEELKIL
jgi:hypothetical protein